MVPESTDATSRSTPTGHRGAVTGSDRIRRTVIVLTVPAAALGAAAATGRHPAPVAARREPGRAAARTRAVGPADDARQRVGLTVAYSAAVALLAFGAGALTVAVGLGKGAWVGVWILYVIWPGAAHAPPRDARRHDLARARPCRGSCRAAPRTSCCSPGCCRRSSRASRASAPRSRSRRPCSSPSASAWSAAVALPLIGYHWAVGFGSMGSSFYMGALTAHLDCHRSPPSMPPWPPSCSGSTACSPGSSSRSCPVARHALREAWPPARHGRAGDGAGAGARRQGRAWHRRPLWRGRRHRGRLRPACGARSAVPQPDPS